MAPSNSYILLLAETNEQTRRLLTQLDQARCAIAIAYSEDQAIAQTREHSPFLVILAGNHHHWSDSLLSRLRQSTHQSQVTVVALTESHNLSWVHQSDNRGFDGFLVNPLSAEVLLSLVQSAYTRRFFAQPLFQFS